MKKTDAIIIMDGFGNRGSENGNAVIKAGTPYIKSLLEKYPFLPVKWVTAKLVTLTLAQAE